MSKLSRALRSAKRARVSDLSQHDVGRRGGFNLTVEVLRENNSARWAAAREPYSENLFEAGEGRKILFCVRGAYALGPIHAFGGPVILRVRIPMNPARHSNRKPATDSDLKPAGIPI
jgi:hypothetical protein